MIKYDGRNDLMVSSMLITPLYGRNPAQALTKESDIEIIGADLERGANIGFDRLKKGNFIRNSKGTVLKTIRGWFGSYIVTDDGDINKPILMRKIDFDSSYDNPIGRRLLQNMYKSKEEKVRFCAENSWDFPVPVYDNFGDVKVEKLVTTINSGGKFGVYGYDTRNGKAFLDQYSSTYVPSKFVTPFYDGFSG